MRGEKADGFFFKRNELALLFTEGAIVSGHQRLIGLHPVGAAGVHMQQLLRLGEAQRHLALVMQPPAEQIGGFAQPVVAGVQKRGEPLFVGVLAKTQAVLLAPGIEH